MDKGIHCTFVVDILSLINTTTTTTTTTTCCCGGVEFGALKILYKILTAVFKNIFIIDE